MASDIEKSSLATNIGNRLSAGSRFRMWVEASFHSTRRSGYAIGNSRQVVVQRAYSFPCGSSMRPSAIAVLLPL
jgi:hypothetical protein